MIRTGKMYSHLKDEYYLLFWKRRWLLNDASDDVEFTKCNDIVVSCKMGFIPIYEF